MSAEEICACDYSYICPMHQRIFSEELEKERVEKRSEKQDQRLEWIASCIKTIAAKLDVELPEEP